MTNVTKVPNLVIKTENLFLLKSPRNLHDCIPHLYSTTHQCFSPCLYNHHLQSFETVPEALRSCNKTEQTTNQMPKTVNLFCPSLSKAVQVIAHDDQKLDLGSIARTFGLDPATLKLNGHFISRGVDLIASSITWKSLISFFSSRGLSTGVCGSGALVVDGKLFKSGCKSKYLLLLVFFVRV